MNENLKWYAISLISACVLGVGALLTDNITRAIIAVGIMISATIAQVGGAR